MSTPEQLQRTVRTLLDSQIQAVLATQHRDQPYTSLMAFAVTPDLRQIVFGHARSAADRLRHLPGHPKVLQSPRQSACFTLDR